MTAISISTGVGSLVALGVSLGDLAVVLHQARKFGNWLRTARLDEELFESLSDVSTSILKRRGLVDATRMQSRWSRVDFLYQGNPINDSSSRGPLRDTQGLSEFSWLMVAVVTALDVCLPPTAVSKFVVGLFARILGDDQELRESLRVQLPTNIESWRSAGCVRGMPRIISHAIQGSRNAQVQERAVPQLNNAEWDEMQGFLVWLMAGDVNDFQVLSATVYAVANALGTHHVGLCLGTGSPRKYENEPIVRYVGESEMIGGFMKLCNDDLSPFTARKSIEIRAQQIAYPNGHPELMIDTIPVKREITNKMSHFWELGRRAAQPLKLVVTTNGPFTPDSDVEYRLEEEYETSKKFAAMLSMIAAHGFPLTSEPTLLALEELTKGCDAETLNWLHDHTAIEYLRSETSAPSKVEKEMNLWVQYQALVFGFYYGLLKQLVCLDYVNEDVYFRGLWGYGSTRFLAMCTMFGDELRRTGRASRTHVLYMLTAMYNGRQKAYSDKSASSGLIGVMGTISILTMSLLHVSDDPLEIAKFAVLDLPVIDLASETNGELYAGSGSGIDFVFAETSSEEIVPHPPGKAWSVHAKMGMVLNEGETGVVMAARCGGRLVGWFSPLAADIAFLSSTYIQRRHVGEDSYVDETAVRGIEISDEDWQRGTVKRPLDNQFIVVHSRGCPAMRYAAAGIFVSAGEEVAISTDDIDGAFGRLELQGSGIIIS